MLDTQTNSVSKIDFTECSKLWDDNEYPNVSPELLMWKYTACFGSKTKQIALYENQKLIGQAIVFLQIHHAQNQQIRIAQLGDLIVKKEHRSLDAVRTIYKGINEELRLGEYDASISLPNHRSVVLNRRFLKMKTTSYLESKIIFSNPFTRKRPEFVQEINSNEDAQEISHHLPDFCSSSLYCHWNTATLGARLKDPNQRFIIVGDKNAIMIASPRKHHGVPYNLVMGIILSKNIENRDQEFQRLASYIAQKTRNPFLISVAQQNQKNTPGYSLPSFIKGKTRPVQTKILNEKYKKLKIENLQLIDLEIV